jgi:hypothetical protein
MAKKDEQKKGAKESAPTKAASKTTGKKKK